MGIFFSWFQLSFKIQSVVSACFTIKVDGFWVVSARSTCFGVFHVLVSTLYSYHLLVVIISKAYLCISVDYYKGGHNIKFKMKKKNQNGFVYNFIFSQKQTYVGINQELTNIIHNNHSSLPKPLFLKPSRLIPHYSPLEKIH